MNPSGTDSLVAVSTIGRPGGQAPGQLAERSGVEAAGKPRCAFRVEVLHEQVHAAAVALLCEPHDLPEVPAVQQCVREPQQGAPAQRGSAHALGSAGLDEQRGSPGADRDQQEAIEWLPGVREELPRTQPPGLELVDLER